MFSPEVSRRELLKLIGATIGGTVLGYPTIRMLLGSSEEGSETRTQPPPKVKTFEDTLNQALQPTPLNNKKVDEDGNDGEVRAMTDQFRGEKKEAVEIPRTGVELLEKFGLKDRIVYIVYGRPAGGWGTLGGSTTAEQTWNLANERRKVISQAISKPESQFGFTVINPVYYFDNRSLGPIKDIYVEKALELAPQNKGLVALDFSDIENSQNVISGFEEKLPVERLVYLAVSLDIEHFLPSGTLEAGKINEFSQWFAKKHKEWSDVAKIFLPGFVFIYTFGGGKILNMDQLKQYYLSEGTMVVPIFDGCGTDGKKLASMVNYIRNLPNTEDYPALLGVMEFQTKHGNRYDTVTPGSTFKTLEGAPVFFFASQ